MLNRHGLIAGATGTGKTKTLQVLAEEFSAHGVPVFLADMKGDLSGLAAPGGSAPARQRMEDMGLAYAPTAFPVKRWSLRGSVNPIQVSVDEFGPLLLARVMRLSRVQTSVLTVVFRSTADLGWRLYDIGDLLASLRYFANTCAGRERLRRNGGGSPATLQVLIRACFEMQHAGLDFFGRTNFSLLREAMVEEDGRGRITLVDLSGVQTSPRAFSAFLMWVLLEVFEGAPEAGDEDRPRMAFFFDEAHLLFEDASPELLSTVRMVVRMIRSKGIGVFFVTQQPSDIPETILSQLGLRVQHALRAFTPKDQKALRDTVATFPATADYDVRLALASLGTGEALMTGLDADGTPLPTVALQMRSPRSSLQILETPPAPVEPPTSGDPSPDLRASKEEDPLPAPALRAAPARSPLSARLFRALRPVGA